VQTQRINKIPSCAILPTRCFTILYHSTNTSTLRVNNHNHFHHQHDINIIHTHTLMRKVYAIPTNWPCSTIPPTRKSSASYVRTRILKCPAKGTRSHRTPTQTTTIPPSNTETMTNIRTTLPNRGAERELSKSGTRSTIPASPPVFAFAVPNLLTRRPVLRLGRNPIRRGRLWMQMWR